MSSKPGHCQGVAHPQKRYLNACSSKRTVRLNNAPDPYRKDNIVFSGFRDGLVALGNGFVRQNKGII